MNTVTIQPGKARLAAGASKAAAFPLLDTGYHLTQSEFHRRYEQMPEIRRAELIEGVVFMSSPLSVGQARASNKIAAWLEVYASETPGTESGGGASVILDHDNEYQPDAHLLISPAHGGQTSLSEGKYVKGAPELVVEISLSSLTHDLHEKQSVYRRSGVCEYLVWSLPEAELHWFNFASGENERLVPNRAGLLCSQVFPGLWLDAQALLAGDMKKVLTVVRRGLASADHREFVKKLSAAK